MKKNVIILLICLTVMSFIAVVVGVGLVAGNLYNNMKVSEFEDNSIGYAGIFIPTNEPVDPSSLFANSIADKKREELLEKFEWECVSSQNESDSVKMSWSEAKNVKVKDMDLLIAIGANDLDGAAILLSPVGNANKELTWRECLAAKQDIFFLSVESGSLAEQTLLHTNEFENIHQAVLAQFGHPSFGEIDRSGEGALIYTYDTVVATIGIVKSENGSDGFDFAIFTSYSDE